LRFVRNCGRKNHYKRENSRKTEVRVRGEDTVDNTLLSISYAMATTVLAMAICSYLFFFTHRARHFKYLGLSFASATARYAVELISRVHPSLFLEIITQALLLAATFYLVGGAQIVVEGDTNRSEFRLLLPLGALSVLTAALPVSDVLRNSPAFLLSGVVTVLCGVRLAKSRIRIRSVNLTGLTLILVGLHRMDYPLFAQDPRLAPAGYLVSSLLTVIVSIGITAVILEDSRNHLADRFRDTVVALSAAIEARDPSTMNHSRRVAEIAQRIAIRAGWTMAQVDELYTAGLLHDIGKIGVLDAVLLKPGKLTPAEFDEIKKHPRFGAEILTGAGKTFEPMIPLIIHHHERWDGTGYPDGISGDAIPRGAAVLAIADAYEAQTSDRPYRSAVGHYAALRDIERCAGTQFDPRLVALCIAHPDVFGDNKGMMQAAAPSFDLA
jgi:HD-GYP domain-containing protein (c-di-GMP phosphodiesterase class II)